MMGSVSLSGWRCGRVFHARALALALLLLTLVSAASAAGPDASTAGGAIKSTLAAPLAVCVWNPTGAGADNWTNPLKWDNCSVGTGPGPGPVGTPGALDSAQINAGTVTLDVAVAVDSLILNGGTLTGNQNITVGGTFNWSNGTLQASTNVFALIASSNTIVTLTGGQKNLNGRTLRLQNINNRWTTGLIELSNGAAIDIRNTATLEIEPGGATERIYFSGVGATPTIANAGSIVKKGGGIAGFDRNITFTQTGRFAVEAGEFKLRANGTSSGDFDVAAGALLEFSAGSFGLLAGSTITGSGALRFGDNSTGAGVYGVAECLSTNGPVTIRNASLTVGCGTLQSFHELRMDHQAAVLQGSAQFAVLSSLQWLTGTIRGNGAPAASITLNATATGTWMNAPPPNPRTLNARDYINLGTTTVTSDSITVLSDNARVVNSSGAIFNLSFGDSTGTWQSLGSGTPEFLNQGTLNMQSGQSNFNPVFTNSGSVNVSAGAALNLRAAGTDTGSYTVASNGTVRVSGPNALRSFTGLGISGGGSLEVLLGGQLAVTAPTYTIFRTNVGGDPNTRLDLSTGALVVIPRLSLSGAAGTITGTSPIEVNEYFVHEGGTITTTTAGVQTLTLTATAGGGQFTSVNEKIYDQRSLVIASTDCALCAPTFVWYDGNVRFVAGASLTVDTLLYTNSNDSLLCTSPCTSALNINGRFVKANDESITIGPGIIVNQAGQLELLTGGINAPGFTQTAGSILVMPNSTNLAVSGDLTIAGGVLTGGGQITGNVVNSGGLFRPGYPGSSVATYTITGNYTQGAGGSLEISTDNVVFYPRAAGQNKSKAPQSPLGVGGMDRLLISGTATLNGLLDLVNGGGNPIPPATFLTASGGVSGVFATYTSDYPALFPSYTSTSAFFAFAPPVVNPVVTSVADPGNGACDVAECTLREAINAANLTAAADIITFNIPGAQCTGTGGTCVIQPLTPLPQIRTAITIDGYSQPGANANTRTIDLGLGSTALIKIEVDGTVAGGVGLELAATGSAVSVEGLAVTDFDTGIRVAEAAALLQLQNGVPVSGTVNSVSAEDDFEEYVVVIPSGIANLDVATTNAAGDVDLYVRFGAAPSLTAYDCRPFSGSGNESCNFPAPAAGIYFVRVYGFDTGPQNFDVTATWTGAGASRGIPATLVTLGGNYLGLHADGSAGTQNVGLAVAGTGLTVGDGSARSMNVISGNQNEGVRLSGASPGSFASIQGNLIGTAPNGTTARPNQYGIKAVSSSNIGGITIGGGMPALGNVIARNLLDGIHLSCDAAADVCFDGMQITGNYIGTNALDAALGNLDDGIAISNLTGGQVSIGSSARNGANVIHHNGGNGIETDNFTGAGRMSFLVNRISSNGAAGIDLANDGPTANDAGDEDAGPNLRQNFPDNLEFVLAAGGGSATIDWEIDTPIGSNYPMRVDFYKQTGDEHDIWLGTASCGLPVRVSCSGSITFPAGVTMAAGDRMAAIVTDSEGRSSEAGFFAAPIVDPVVNSIADPGNGTCDAAECTLREAIDAANVTPAADTVSFAIPAAQCTGAGGACVIVASADMPQITTPMSIDGYTQTGATPNSQAMNLGLGSNASIKIELNGTGDHDGIDVNAPGASVRIEGLAIYHFSPWQLSSSGDATSSVHFGGNFLGLKADGSVPPAVPFNDEGYAGVSTRGGTVTIGDGTARGMNVISGSLSSGISLRDAPSGTSFSIKGNLIGTAPDGITARGNRFGIVAGESVPGIVIGGNTLAQANVIGGNGGDGIVFSCFNASGGCFGAGISVVGNFIGVGINGQPVGNSGHGIDVRQLAAGAIAFGGTTVAQANLIANNRDNGINIEPAPPQSATEADKATAGSLGSVAVLINRTRANGGLGVDVLSDGRTPNDAGDVDAAQNFPVINTFVLNPGGTGANIGYVIDTPDFSRYPMRVDFYRGDNDELGAWLGTAACGAPPSADKVTNCTADLTFPVGVSLTASDSVVAIATNANGSSSEASYYSTTTTIISDDPDPSEVGTNYTVVVEVVSNSPFSPQGTVDVGDQRQNSCTATLARTATGTSRGNCLLPSALPAGTYNVFADYPADAGPFTSSFAADVPHTVIQTLATATSIITIAPDVTVTGQPYTVTVNVLSGGTPVTAGTITVRQLSDGAMCTIVLSPPAGTNSCQLVAYSAVTTAVRATYSGATGFGPSQSSITSHVVNRANTVVAILSDSPDPSVVNQPITVTMSLGVVAPGAGTPTGTLFVTDGIASCGVQLPNLSCTFVPKALGAGTLEARYLGDANFNESVDTETHTVTVNGADLSISKFNGLRLLPGGSTVSYVLLVNNLGPQAVVNARVNDILPTQLSGASWTCAASAGASCPASGTGTVDTLVSLQPGASVSFVLQATVQLSPEQIVTNRATVTPPANAPDPVMSNNESVDTDSMGLYGDGFESENE